MPRRKAVWAEDADKLRKKRGLDATDTDGHKQRLVTDRDMMGISNDDEEDEGGLFDFSSAVDFEIDFSLDDFDREDDSGFMDAFDMSPDPEAQELVRILKPSIDVASVSHYVQFDNAVEFAKQVDLTPGSRTFAWVSGNFIFGDIPEALVNARNVGIKKMWITSLSFSAENIDSIKNIMLTMGDELDELVLIFSGYQYSHEKFNLVPYMYSELDTDKNILQIAFGGWHAKIIEIETSSGHTISMHGSANLRSSNSVEQVMIEIDNHDLHEFNRDIMRDIAKRFGTINHKAPVQRLKRIEGRQAWELSRDAAIEAAARLEGGE